MQARAATVGCDPCRVPGAVWWTGIRVDLAVVGGHPHGINENHLNCADSSICGLLVWRVWSERGGVWFTLELSEVGAFTSGSVKGRMCESSDVILPIAWGKSHFCLVENAESRLE